VTTAQGPGLGVTSRTTTAAAAATAAAATESVADSAAVSVGLAPGEEETKNSDGAEASSSFSSSPSSSSSSSSSSSTWEAVPSAAGSEFFYSLCRVPWTAETFFSLAPSTAKDHTMSVVQWERGSANAQVNVDERLLSVDGVGFNFTYCPL
jgi:hypothetical protein